MLFKFVFTLIDSAAAAAEARALGNQPCPRMMPLVASVMGGVGTDSNPLSLLKNDDDYDDSDVVLTAPSTRTARRSNVTKAASSLVQKQPMAMTRHGAGGFAQSPRQHPQLGSSPPLVERRHGGCDRQH